MGNGESATKDCIRNTRPQHTDISNEFVRRVDEELLAVDEDGSLREGGANGRPGEPRRRGFWRKNAGPGELLPARAAGSRRAPQ
jgi:hypothetical protein